ncbi:hypothetical protein ACGLWX_17240 [Halomonas sp. HMF6819]|uniref:hypothetical protein n=1 Tax=unclassified Halomonas TaxID=2609666 RepID=UPI0020767F60|nr:MULTISPECIES: hypothetical protein [unclassified Halomonas]
MLVVKVVALVFNAPDKPPGAAPPAVTPALADVVVVLWPAALELEALLAGAEPPGSTPLSIDVALSGVVCAEASEATSTPPATNKINAFFNIALSPDKVSSRHFGL